MTERTNVAQWAAEICDDGLASSRISEWERGYLTSIKAQLDDGRTLTDKQITTLENIERKIYSA